MSLGLRSGTKQDLDVFWEDWRFFLQLALGLSMKLWKYVVEWRLVTISGIISSKKILDRETQPQFVLTVTATDGGGLSCQSELFVTLTDVNDNEPTFTQSQYTVSIPENAEINTLLTRVSASDEDLGKMSLLPSSWHSHIFQSVGRRIWLSAHHLLLVDCFRHQPEGSLRDEGVRRPLHDRHGQRHRESDARTRPRGALRLQPDALRARPGNHSDEVL